MPADSCNIRCMEPSRICNGTSSSDSDTPSDHSMGITTVKKPIMAFAAQQFVIGSCGTDRVTK